VDLHRATVRPWRTLGVHVWISTELLSGHGDLWVSKFGTTQSYCRGMVNSACPSLDLDKVNIGPWRTLFLQVWTSTELLSGNGDLWVSKFGPQQSYCQAMEISGCPSLDLNKATVRPQKSLGVQVWTSTELLSGHGELWVFMFGPRQSYCRAMENSGCPRLDFGTVNVKLLRSLGAHVSQTTSP
jgi:hypothetical protein